VRTDPPDAYSGGVSGRGGSGAAPTGRAGSAAARPGGVIATAEGLELVCRSVLGQGGMGVVYLVDDPRLGRPAALKVVREPGQRQRAERFQREARITARLDHPGIPPVYAAGRTRAGQPYLLMRYVEGESLEERLRRRPAAYAEPRQLLHALVKVAEALAYAHSRQVIHRDLKPDNVMLGRFGEVLLMDWGLARDLEQSSSDDLAVRRALGDEAAAGASPSASLTQDGAILGTLGYMPPEQAAGEDVDARADVFALGAVLAGVLTGAPPLEVEEGLNPLFATASGHLTPPRAREPAVAPELDAIARRALEPEPARRYSSAEAFARDLLAYLEGRPVSVHRYGRWEQSWRLVRRNPAPFTALGVAFLLTVVGILAVVHSRRQAAAAERARVVAASRLAAEAAWAELEAAAPLAASADLPAEQRQRALEPRTAGALAALTAAQRWHALAPDDPAAASARFRAALALGEAAAAGEQWTLAAQAFADAADLAVDDARAREAAADLEAARSADAERRARTLEVVLERAARGEVRDADAVTAAVLEIARVADARTVPRLAEALDGVTAELWAAARQVFLEAASPTAAEAARGVAPIEGVAAALERYAALPPAAPVPPDVRAPLRAAAARLRARGVVDGPVEVGAAELLVRTVAARQEGAVGAHRLQLARLCGEALGHLGRGPAEGAAADALGRYLAAEFSQIRAVPAGLALCRLGATGRLRRALDRFRDASGPFSKRVGGYMRRHGLRLELGPDPEPGAGPGADDPGAARVKEARELILTGDPERALRRLRALLERDPDDAAALSVLGTALQHLGRYREARRAFDRSLALDADQVWARSGRGIVRSQLGDLEGALADLGRALALDPAHALSYTGRAQVLQDLGRLDEALADTRRAIDLDPSLGIAHAVQGEIHHDRGELRPGLAAMERAVDLDPERADWVSKRGQFRRFLGDARGALADHTRAVELDPTSPRIWCELGLARLDLGDLEGARRAVDEALRRDPRHAFALGLRGGLHMMADEPEEALAVSARAVEVDPTQAPAWKIMGQVHLLEGRYEAALAAFDRAAETGPGEPEVFLLRGYLHMITDRGDAAVADLREHLRRTPRDRRVRVLLGALGAGGPQLERLAGGAGGYDALLARFVLERATLEEVRAYVGQRVSLPLERDRALSEVHGYAALRAETAGRPAEAREHYARALELGGESSGSVYTHLARARLGAGR